MTRRAALALALVATFAVAALPPFAAAQDDAWKPTKVELVTGGLSQPVDVAFGRDGYAYFVELTDAAVRRVDLSTGALDPEPVVELRNVSVEKFTETGLFGLALHPEFHANGVMFVSYSVNASGEWTNRLSRVDARTGEEAVLMERPGGKFHNGGRVAVADGHLWWTSGDATNPFTDPPEEGQVAQENDVMRGKVMRLTMEGAPADGNPWGNAAWTKGHRNVYGLAWDPENARFLVTENGNAEADELNILEKGANYGWPECEGRCAEPRPEFTEPVHAWDGTVAPTGATWFRGAFWFGTFNRGDVHRFSDESGAWALQHVHHYPGNEDMPPRVLDVEAGPDGRTVYFTTWDELWRMDFADDPAYPAQDPKAGGPYWWEEDAGDGATGDANATDPGSDADDEDDDMATGNVIPPAGTIAVVVTVTIMVLVHAGVHAASNRKKR